MTFVPERWDVGLWDEAHWDGQLGFEAAPASVVITPQPAIFSKSKLLTALPASVVITSQSATFTISRKFIALPASVVITPNAANLFTTTGAVLTALPASVIITGNTADLSVHIHHHVMQAVRAQIHIIPSLADLEVFHNPYPFPQPGRITMGRPKFFVDRW